MKKRIIALLLVLILVLGALSACGQKEEEPQQPEKQEEPQKEPEPEPEPEGNFRKITGNKETNSFTRMYAEPDSFDHGFHSKSHESVMIDLLFDCLYVLNPDGEYVPELATEMTPNEDGTVVDVTLREGVTFHNGEKFTSADVVFSLQHLELSLYDDLFQNSYMEVVDDYHLKWYFPNENNSFYNLSDRAYRLSIFCKSYYEAKYDPINQDFTKDVMGTGPYTIESYDPTTGTYTFKKWADYWGTRGYLDTIKFVCAGGDGEIAFEAGDVDWVEITGSQIAVLEEYDNVSFDTRFTNTLYYLVCNSAEGHPTADIRVREALQYAFDREELAMLCCDGSGILAWNMIPPDTQFHADIQPHRTLDLAKAQALMKEAGYSETNRCKVTLQTTTVGIWVATMEALKENLEQCYFECEINQYVDFTPYFAGEFDIGIIGIGLGKIFSTYSMIMDPTTGLALCYYDGEDCDEIVDAFKTAADQEAANKAVMMLDATFCYCPLAYSADIAAFDEDLDISDAWNGTDYDYARIKWK